MSEIESKDIEEIETNGQQKIQILFSGEEGKEGKLPIPRSGEIFGSYIFWTYGIQEFYGKVIRFTNNARNGFCNITSYGHIPVLNKYYEYLTNGEKKYLPEQPGVVIQINTLDNELLDMTKNKGMVKWMAQLKKKEGVEIKDEEAKKKVETFEKLKNIYMMNNAKSMGGSEKKREIRDKMSEDLFSMLDRTFEWFEMLKETEEEKKGGRKRRKSRRRRKKKKTKKKKKRRRRRTRR